MLLNMENTTEITNSRIGICRHWLVVGYAKYNDRWYTINILSIYSFRWVVRCARLFIKDVWYT